MATFSQNVSGLARVIIPLSANLTNITLSNAVDAQQIVIEFSNEGGYTVASSSINGLANPPAGISFQQFIFNANTGTWTSSGGGGGSAGGGFAPPISTIAGTITGTFDGLNVDFVMDAVPTSPLNLILFLNGIYQVQGTDYTLTGATIVMTNPPMPGSNLVAI